MGQFFLKTNHIFFRNSKTPTQSKRVDFSERSWINDDEEETEPVHLNAVRSSCPGVTQLERNKMKKRFCEPQVWDNLFHCSPSRFLKIHEPRE